MTLAIPQFQTVFAILSGQGDQLTIDPVTFYKRIASIALDLSQADEQEDDSSQVTAHSVMYEVLKSAFIVRRKKVRVFSEYSRNTDFLERGFTCFDPGQQKPVGGHLEACLLERPALFCRGRRSPDQVPP